MRRFAPTIWRIPVYIKGQARFCTMGKDKPVTVPQGPGTEDKSNTDPDRVTGAGVGLFDRFEIQT